jgi:hypothetical protein
MQTYHTAAKVSNDGTLTLKELPFRAGDEVEVTVRSRGTEHPDEERYPLRRKPFRYVDPFESVAQADWNVLQ